jgi:hypothetical protein
MLPVYWSNDDIKDHYILMCHQRKLTLQCSAVRGAVWSHRGFAIHWLSCLLDDRSSCYGTSSRDFYWFWFHNGSIRQPMGKVLIMWNLENFCYDRLQQNGRGGRVSLARSLFLFGKVYWKDKMDSSFHTVSGSTGRAETRGCRSLWRRKAVLPSLCVSDDSARFPHWPLCSSIVTSFAGTVCLESESH